LVVYGLDELPPNRPPPFDLASIPGFPAVFELFKMGLIPDSFAPSSFVFTDAFSCTLKGALLSSPKVI